MAKDTLENADRVLKSLREDLKQLQQEDIRDMLDELKDASMPTDMYINTNPLDLLPGPKSMSIAQRIERRKIVELRRASMRDIEEAIKKIEAEMSEVEVPVNKAFPCPPKTKWESVQIIITSHTTARITTPAGTSNYSYHDLGFQDRRKGDAPIRLWDTLLLFAKCGGRVDGKVFIRMNQKDVVKFMDNARSLDKKFKRLSGIDESIFRNYYRKSKAYITRFKKIQDKREGEELEEPEQSPFDLEIDSAQQKISGQRKTLRPAE